MTAFAVDLSHRGPLVCLLVLSDSQLKVLILWQFGCRPLSACDTRGGRVPLCGGVGRLPFLSLVSPHARFLLLFPHPSSSRLTIPLFS